LPLVKDKAERDKWLKWHSAVKRKLKDLLSGDVESERSYDLSGQMDWGRLDRYKPDITWRKNNELSFFEVEYYFNQDKVVRDIVYAHFLGAKQLVFVFSNKRTEWGNGRKRVEATHCLAEKLLEHLPKPLHIKAISVIESEEIERKLKDAKIM